MILIKSEAMKVSETLSSNNFWVWPSFIMPLGLLNAVIILKVLYFLKVFDKELKSYFPQNKVWHLKMFSTSLPNSFLLWGNWYELILILSMYILTLTNISHLHNMKTDLCVHKRWVENYMRRHISTERSDKHDSTADGLLAIWSAEIIFDKGL